MAIAMTQCPTCHRQRAATVPDCGYCTGRITPSIGAGSVLGSDNPTGAAPTTGAPTSAPASGGFPLSWIWWAGGAAVTYWLVNNSPFHRLPIIVGMLALAALIVVVLVVIAGLATIVKALTRR